MEWNTELIRNALQEELSYLLFVRECYEVIGDPSLHLIMANGQKFKISIEEEA